MTTIWHLFEAWLILNGILACLFFLGIRDDENEGE